MTRETAIKGLKAFRKEFSGYEPNEEMFDMAIQALEQEPTTKNDLGVDCVDKRKVMCYTCRFCKMDICDGKPYCSLREKGGKCYSYDSWDSQENVLDKIRAEIENGTHHFLDGEPIIEIKEALQIIDKYKAERTDNEKV